MIKVYGDITEKYNMNDLKILDKKYTEKLIEKNEIYDYETYKLTINYVQIEGLKNKTIEEKINKEIRDKVFSMYTKEEVNDNNIQRIDIYAICQANYGNVLSILITKNLEVKNSKGYNDYLWDESESLNYNLKTGEYLEFEDLFTSDASIKNLLTQGAYDSLFHLYANNYDYDSNYEEGLYRN